VVGLADMMICGRDSNTSCALGNANIAQCQMPTAGAVNARVVSLVLTPNGRRLRYFDCCGTVLALDLITATTGMFPA